MIRAIAISLGFLVLFFIGAIAFWLSWDGPAWVNRTLGLLMVLGALAVMLAVILS